MPSRSLRPRRPLLATVLAAVLVGELTGIAVARTIVPAATSLPSSPSVSAVRPPVVRDTDRASSGGGQLSPRVADTARDAVAISVNAARVRSAAPASPPAEAPVSPAGSTSTAPKAPASTIKSSGAASSGARSSAYQGRNRVWIPSLGINKSIQSFPCSRTRPPDAGVYRWGCAGRNNVYLLSHAWSTFKPLHDAYVRGRLSKGMKVHYADGSGTVRTYSVIWWKVTAPTTAAKWAWASLDRPSMTLQTCVGAHSEYRLMVRLVRVG
jgi:hypothetical protein